MTPRRLVLGTTGVTLVLAVLVASNLIAPIVPVDDAVSVLGNDYFLVGALGIVSLVVAAGAVSHGRRTNQARVPNPEHPITVPAPGDELTATLDQWRLVVPVVGRHQRRAIRSRLRESAIHVIQHAENCSADEARDRVDSGAWTTDPDAAAFLATGQHLSLGGYFRAARSRTTGFAHGARRTAVAIAQWGATDRIYAQSTDRERGPR